jgi:hypothetical protein
MIDIKIMPKLNIDEFDESEHIYIKDFICTLCGGVFNNPILISTGKCFCKECFYYFNEKYSEIAEEKFNQEEKEKENSNKMTIEISNKNPDENPNENPDENPNENSNEKLNKNENKINSLYTISTLNTKNGIETIDLISSDDIEMSQLEPLRPLENFKEELIVTNNNSNLDCNIIGNINNSNYLNNPEISIMNNINNSNNSIINNNNINLIYNNNDNKKNEINTNTNITNNILPITPSISNLIPNQILISKPSNLTTPYENIRKYEKKLICPATMVEINPNKITEVKILTQKINNFIIFCENKNQNCNWKGILKDREGHLQICNRAVIYCKNTNCKVFNFREDIIKHESTCNFRNEKCRHCSIDYLAAEEEKHLEICEFLKLPCRNFCGEMIERKFMNIHLENNCGNSLIFCPLNKYNLCDEKLLRNNLKFHFVDKHLEHFLKFAEGFSKMEEKFQNEIFILQENNTNLLNSNKILFEELNYLKEINVNLSNHQKLIELKLSEEEIKNENKIKKLEEKFIDIDLKINNLDNYFAINNNNNNKIFENFETFDKRDFKVNKRLDILENKFEEEIINQFMINKNLNILSIKNVADNNNNNSYINNINENFLLGNKRKNCNSSTSNNNSNINTKEILNINDSSNSINNNNKENILNNSSSLNDTENSNGNLIANDNKEINLKKKLKNKKELEKINRNKNKEKEKEKDKDKEKEKEKVKDKEKDSSSLSLKSLLSNENNTNAYTNLISENNNNNKNEINIDINMDLDYISSKDKEEDINSINSINNLNSNFSLNYVNESNKKQKKEENKIHENIIHENKNYEIDCGNNKSESIIKNESGKNSNFNSNNSNIPNNPNNLSINFPSKSQSQSKSKSFYQSLALSQTQIKSKEKLKEIHLNLIANEEEDNNNNNINNINTHTTQKKISLNLDQEILKKDSFPLFDYNNSSNLLLIKENTITAIGDINCNHKHKFVFFNENLFNKPTEYTITINKLNSWFAIGAAYHTIVQRNKYEFKGIPYRQHGCFLLSFNKGLTFTWNCFKQEQNNNTLNNFSLQKGDIIKMRYYPEEGMLDFSLKNFNTRLRGIKLYERYELKPCLILTETGDQVEIMKSL